MGGKNISGRKNVDYSAIFIVTLFAILLIVIMGISAVAGDMFDSITQDRQNNLNIRAALSYVSAKVKAADMTGALSVEKGEDSDILVIRGSIHDKDYETRIYLEDGYLVESMTATSSSDGSEDGAIASEGSLFISSEPNRIAEASEFSVNEDSQIITITTNDGVRLIYLHSKGAIS